MDYDAVTESGRNSVSKHQIDQIDQIDDSAWVWRVSRLTRDERAKTLPPSTKFSSTNEYSREKNYPV